MQAFLASHMKTLLEDNYFYLGKVNSEEMHGYKESGGPVFRGKDYWRRFFNECQQTEGTNITDGCATEMKRLQGKIDLYFQKGYNVVISAEELPFFTEGARNLVKDMFKNFRIIIVMVC